MRTGFKIAAFLTIAIAAVIIIMLSPAFDIDAVVIRGNVSVTADAIKTAAGLDKPRNIFAFGAGRAERELLKNTYIASASIAKDYLGKSVEIGVRERRLSGYVEFLSGTYIYIDDTGYVLETAKTMRDKLPVIQGLSFTEFTAGQPLNVGNELAFEAVVTLEQLFNTYNLQSVVVKLDVADVNHVHAYIKNLDFDLGEIVDADQKVRMMKAIYEKLSDTDVRATIDLTDANKDALFKLLK